MNPLKIVANLIMHGASLLAPSDRADRVRAMKGEFVAIARPDASLDWALGCLAVAANWRVRADSVYFLALGLSVLLAPDLLLLPLAFRAQQQFEPYLAIACAGGLFLPGLVVSIIRPDRVALTSVLLTCSIPGCLNALRAVLISLPYSAVSGQGVNWTEWFEAVAIIAVLLALSLGASLVGRLLGYRLAPAH